ncbi:MAG: RNA polymerase sigma factor [Alphaproteobacteria bacterium]|nr:MAG: RNA polymerase sigma factor [Alphaproteobacteria bacterium]
MRHEPVNYETIDDAELVLRAVRREAAAIRVITTRNNQRLFRAAWGVLRNHADAEEVVQEAYLKAFTSLENFVGNSSLSTWLTRIVHNAAIDRQRTLKRRRENLLEQNITMLDDPYSHFVPAQGSRTPETALARKQFAHSLKEALADLAEEFRSVFILRVIEGMSVSETADVLRIREATVKSRLFRTRRELRKRLEIEFEAAFSDTIPFAGVDCEAMTLRVLAALKL